MGRIVLLNKKGLTLVEVMIALVVLLFVSLAMMQTAIVSIDSNTINNLRDEAVRIAEQRMEEARNLATDDLVDDGTDTNLTATICPSDFVSSFGTTGLRVQRNVRNISDFSFCTNRNVTALNADNKEIVITVAWLWKGNPYTHRITSIVRRQ